MNLQRIELDAWLRDVVSEYEVPDTVTMIYQPAPMIELWLDPDRFRRVLINVFDNACQAISARAGASHAVPHTSGQLQIVSTCIGSDIYIAIRDNGVGMAPEVLANIFEPLYSTKVFGVGLGLTIVREIVRQHGGDIRVTSQPGEGSEVELCLPQSLYPRDHRAIDKGHD